MSCEDLLACTVYVCVCALVPLPIIWMISASRTPSGMS